MSSQYRVASLFCGCGGCDLGLMGGFWYLGRGYPDWGYDIAYAVDFDRGEVVTYNANFAPPAVCADVMGADWNRSAEASLCALYVLVKSVCSAVLVLCALMVAVSVALALVRAFRVC